MRAVVFAGEGRIAVDDVPEPKLLDPGDAIVKVHKTAICGSDLHLLDGKTPGMRDGSIIGHEFVGTVVHATADVDLHPPGTRVVGSFLIACGRCDPCGERRYNHCAHRRALGLGTLTGDLDGAQAEYVRVPDADVNLFDVGTTFPGLSDEQALFAGDVLTTGSYAAQLSEIDEGDVVVVIGAGPVGVFSAFAARSRGAGQVVVVDTDPKRVGFARSLGLDAANVRDQEAAGAVAAMTGGRMADVVIEAVGATSAFRSALKVVRDGGRVTVVGVYGAERFDLPMGVAWVRGLDLRFSGMANIQANWRGALEMVASDDVDPTRIVSHRLPLAEAEEGYELFRAREAMKVVLTP